ncbi:phosphatase PAP2 family protein [Edaphobacter albus]|uniref:phosphatase PAP2 family protein n=1 Tax=Edaphobacter sp. 4G125 TaxID=2763071 RepID=UPI001647B4FF|nr:phosphatase PAP2 family protein [Edaphobacter sp. 4G125]QNI37293.1 phosphatase PAP2 family protein [Edaphobacter sp. 4G125]
MRTSEWIQIGFAAVFTVAAWATAFTPRPLPMSRRWKVSALAVVAFLVIAFVHLAEPHLSHDSFLTLLDVVTGALFLVPYWQTGQFFLGPNPQVQNRLEAFDRWLLPNISSRSGTKRNSIGFVLEMAYLSCYPLVPLALIAVYAAGLREKIDEFWFVLLISTYLCYAITPLVPAFPPRAPSGEPPMSAERGQEANKGRVFNRWILKHGSIHAISFPSAHVASAFAIALVLLHHSLWLGAIFLVIAVLISLGAVVGRYHYALDVLMGAVTALIVFGIHSYLPT